MGSRPASSSSSPSASSSGSRPPPSSSSSGSRPPPSSSSSGTRPPPPPSALVAPGCLLPILHGHPFSSSLPPSLPCLGFRLSPLHPLPAPPHSAAPRLHRLPSPRIPPPHPQATSSQTSPHPPDARPSFCIPLASSPPHPASPRLFVWPYLCKPHLPLLYLHALFCLCMNNPFVASPLIPFHAAITAYLPAVPVHLPSPCDLGTLPVLASHHSLFLLVFASRPNPFLVVACPGPPWRHPPRLPTSRHTFPLPPQYPPRRRLPRPPLRHPPPHCQRSSLRRVLRPRLSSTSPRPPPLLRALSSSSPAQAPPFSLVVRPYVLAGLGAVHRLHLHLVWLASIRKPMYPGEPMLSSPSASALCLFRSGAVPSRNSLSVLHGLRAVARASFGPRGLRLQRLRSPDCLGMTPVILLPSKAFAWTFASLSRCTPMRLSLALSPLVSMAFLWSP